MKRYKWVTIALVFAVSIAFVFAGPQAQEKTNKKDVKKMERSLDEALSGLEALKALEALEDLKIDLSGLDRLKDLEWKLEGLEALEDLDLDLNLEGLQALSALEDMEMNLNLESLEALEALKDFDLGITLEGLALAMESLQVLEHMDLHFDFDDLYFNLDDFDFDFDFNFEWIKDLDWDWEDEDNLEKGEKAPPRKAAEKIKKSR